MNHNGKVSVAPCGHTGETIIGTYVRCLVGCEGPAVVTKRGVVGHVDNCACKPCQFRRVTTHIILKNKAGKEVLKVEWDGSSKVTQTSVKDETDIRAFVFLDKDGKILGRGMTSAYLYEGIVSIEPGRMIDGLIENHVTKYCVYQNDDVRIDALSKKIMAAFGAPFNPGPPNVQPTTKAPGFAAPNVVVKGP